MRKLPEGLETFLVQDKELRQMIEPIQRLRLATGRVNRLLGPRAEGQLRDVVLPMSSGDTLTE
jgi:hypothetical protein